MDLLLVGDTYACDGDSAYSDRRRSQIILSQKQYNDRLYESYRKGSILYDSMASAVDESAQFIQTHPVYEVKNSSIFSEPARFGISINVY